MMYLTIRKSIALAILAVAAAFATAAAAPSTADLWEDVSPTVLPQNGDRIGNAISFRSMALDVDGMLELLGSLPAEGSFEAELRPEILLPMPDGTFASFAVVESPIMAPELQAKYPEIRTYAGYGIDDPTATIRFDLTPHGFHAMVLSDNGTIIIDPYQRGDARYYQSYYRSERAHGGIEACTVVDDDHMADEIARLIREDGGNRPSGTQLRTYRAAVAATGEYTTFHGGTVALGLAAVVTSMNRVTGVYEREVSIRMTLIANNNLIIYTNAATDPYTNNNGGTMLGQNQSNLDSVIGNANYDIGHVFSTGGGGIAGLGVVCRTGNKARGVTGSSAPIGDNFDIDYVAHEIGHQFGSNHCFNGNAGSCGGGNRNASTAYEPGSGSTIMAYAGICGSQNLQAHSDDYFVWISIQEIVTYSTAGAGNTCPVVTATGAIEPVVDAGAGGFTIPLNTPFILTGSATTTGTPTYCWEESDLGPAGHPNTPTGNAPIFRSFDPVPGTERIFPRLSNLLNNTQTIGEILPSYARNLSFKLTVRDFQAGGVGVAFDGMTFAVAATGPFLVTYPNTNVLLQGGMPVTVTWDVASTNVAPVNCADVTIELSVDGGYTWPHVLVGSTPNDGSETVTLTNVATNTARIRVRSLGNVFFDISNASFRIEETVDVAEPVASQNGLVLHASRPNPAASTTAITFEMPRAGVAELRVYDMTGRLVRTLVNGSIDAGSHEVTWNGRDDAGSAVSAGVYLYKLTFDGQSLSSRVTVLR